MSNRKYFGTDGIRGRVGDAPITPDFVLKLGWAAGKVLARHGSRKIIIGKDTRISGYMLESALEAGLAAAGLSALFTGPMPTPAVAYLTRTFRAEAGIVISASHNPFYDNGIKFFSIDGTKLPDAVEEAIEAEMEKEISCVDSAELGKASRIVDAAGRYIEFCKATFPNELSLSELKIVVDCANGATYHIAPNVLRELGANVIAIGCEPNGVNINAEVGVLEEADAWRAEAWEMMRIRHDLRFLFFTKRIDRLAAVLPPDWGDGYENVVIGCTVENQAMADYRLLLFLATPVRHRLIVCAPLLGPLDIARYLSPAVEEVSAGGESGNEARPCDYAWVLGLREQCVAADISFCFHQTGARFVKDGRMYRIHRRYQHSQARKAGIDYRLKR